MADIKTKVEAYFEEISPYKFEQFVADIWEQYGWETTVTDKTQDRGIDIIAHKESPVQQKIVIQTKAYDEGNRIGSDEIRRYATLHEQEDQVDSLVIVTTGYFTESASDLAADLDVKLVDRRELIDMITEVEAHDEIEKANSQGKTAPEWLTSSADELPEGVEESGFLRLAYMKEDFDEIVEKMEASFDELEEMNLGRPRKYTDCPVCDQENSIWGMEREISSSTLEDVVDRWRICVTCGSQWAQTRTETDSPEHEEWVFLTGPVSGEAKEYVELRRAPFEHWSNIKPKEGVFKPNPFTDFELEKQPILSDELVHCPLCEAKETIWMASTKTHYDRIAKCENCRTVWLRDLKLIREDRWKYIKCPNKLQKIDEKIREKAFK